MPNPSASHEIFAPLSSAKDQLHKITTTQIRQAATQGKRLTEAASAMPSSNNNKKRQNGFHLETEFVGNKKPKTEQGGNANKENEKKETSNVTVPLNKGNYVALNMNNKIPKTNGTTTIGNNNIQQTALRNPKTTAANRINADTTTQTQQQLMNNSRSTISQPSKLLTYSKHNTSPLKSPFWSPTGSSSNEGLKNLNLKGFVDSITESEKKNHNSSFFFVVIKVQKFGKYMLFECSSSSDCFIATACLEFETTQVIENR